MCSKQLPASLTLAYAHTHPCSAHYKLMTHRHSARPGAPQAKVYQNLGFGGLNLNSSPRSSLAPSAASYSGSPRPAKAHRKPVATLNFPQFLEALRLVAEDMIGHPAVSEGCMALWDGRGDGGVVYESVAVGQIHPLLTLNGCVEVI
jgi:hypothetical protein